MGKILLAISMLFATLLALSTCRTIESDKPHKEPAPANGSAAQAREGCKQFISRLSHDPESLDFGNYWDWRTTEPHLGKWIVETSFRGTNAYGAKVLSKKTCTITITGDNVSLDSLR